MKKVSMALLVLSISLIFLVFALEQNAYDKDYYLEKFQENNTEIVTGKNMDELEVITYNLILYLKGGENDLLRPHFNEKEILHMEDVKELFNIARIIKYIGIIVGIISSYLISRNKNIKLLAKTLFYGLFANHIILSIIGFLAYQDFNKYFTYFHLIFFTNDLWLLDPNTDLMIQMLPENFFFGMATNIMRSFLMYITVVQVISLLFLKKNKFQDE